ncbi:MAG: hypothetical protein WAW86_05460 [Gammaproteobacteria bacterium]
MDPRHLSPIEQAIKRYIKLLTLKSNHSIRSENAKLLLGELRSCLYRYLGVILPEEMGEVVPLQSLSELAAKKVYEKNGFEEMLREVSRLIHDSRMQGGDVQLEKIKKRAGNMLKGYKRLTRPVSAGQDTDNVFEI